VGGVVPVIFPSQDAELWPFALWEAALLWSNTVLMVHTTEFRSCVKVEVADLGSPSLIVPTFSVDVKQH